MMTYRIHQVVVRFVSRQTIACNRSSVSKIVYRRPIMSVLASTFSTNNSDYQHCYYNNTYLTTTAAITAAASALCYTTTVDDNKKCQCDAAANNNNNNNNNNNQTFTPSSVAKEDFEDIQQSHNIDDLPIYTSEQVAVNNGENGKPMWMSYGGVVYDVTEFIHNHPGGSEKIVQAAGSAIEPFWLLYRQHYASDLPMRLMEHMAIGRLSEQDQDDIDQQIEILEQDDPYANEPERNKVFRIHSDTPMNAEIPTSLLTQSYITPNELFYIRHHHPVPNITQEQIKDYKLQVDLSAYEGGEKVYYSIDDLKNLPQTEITVTMQCSGNRRGGFNTYKRTSGTPWSQGAISTAKYKGVLLRHLLEHAGLDNPIAAQEEMDLEHIRFRSKDGMHASIRIEKAMNPYGDCLVALEMNDEPIPRDHGYPIRVIVPGYAAVRSVKWLDRIKLAKTEAEGAWQRGLNYKILPPNVTDANEIDLKTMPSVMETSVFSGITRIERTESSTVNPGDRIQIKVGGWAYAGGGRNIVRVDISGDGGTTWNTATLQDGSNQRYGRAWAWTFWECTLPVVVLEDGTVHVTSKAIDIAFNVQPERSDPIWNVRGLSNNSWYKAHARVL